MLEEHVEQMGLSSSVLGSYKSADTKDIGRCTHIKLVKFYDVTTDYLFGPSEMKRHPNADLADLRLSDGILGLL